MEKTNTILPAIKVKAGFNAFANGPVERRGPGGGILKPDQAGAFLVYNSPQAHKPHPPEMNR